MGGPNVNWKLVRCDVEKKRMRNDVTQKTYQQFPKGRGKRNWADKKEGVSGKAMKYEERKDIPDIGNNLKIDEN